MRTFWFEYRGARYVIRQGETLVGRGDECTLQVDDVAVSRQHLMVRRTGDIVTLTDLGSSNGSIVNGQPLLGTRSLRSGDRVMIGKSELLLGSRDSIESTVPPGIEILEQRRMPSQAEISTEPEFSTVAVLESLIKNREAAEDTVQLAWMIRKSVDHLLAGIGNRGMELGPEHCSRLLHVVQEAESWISDGSFADWAKDVRDKLGSA
ncbi:MAG TPA: FHA domain-containing protein [Polyangiaceae bacterium]|nr:FHA domain-containing protein [Polyangiaceae bacterium]